MVWVCYTWVVRGHHSRRAISRQQLKSTYLVIDEGSKGQVIEQVGEKPPHIGVAVLPETLVVESIHLRDLSRLVISAQDGHPIPITEFHGYQQGDGFDGIVAAIDVVAHE